ncbi:unnamed protein product [Paramecium octaurelia]|uniref:Uncharacterized protein n=1 Tax=Paramecium octaurelia TaxID=43137 RepID=A0A8S1S4K7_PAROT|nr:unnamed protein product [Paramecium octaurelia]
MNQEAIQPKINYIRIYTPLSISLQHLNKQSFLKFGNDKVIKQYKGLKNQSQSIEQSHPNTLKSKQLFNKSGTTLMDQK